jgi:N-acetylglutamate synthase-like GNAT family acetyltransferase
MDDLNAIKRIADANRSSLGFVLRPALQAGIGRGWMFIAENDQRSVIGFVHYHHRHDLQTTLYELCVENTWREKGVGRMLVNLLILESRNIGKKTVRLKAPIDLPSNQFYQKIGFKLVGKEVGKCRNLNIWEIFTDRNIK